MIDTLNLIDSQERKRLMQEPVPQIEPRELMELHPLSNEAKERIESSRLVVADILSGVDPRLLVVVGPCSLDDKHEPGMEPAVIQYTKMLKEIAADPVVAQKLFIVMRCPPAKPRTSVGQRGLEQYNLVRSHELLTEIVELGLPLSVDLMNEKHIARYGDLLSLGWVGARDMSVTGFRHTLSAFPELPVLLKNNETGDIQKALQAIETIAASHVNVEVQMPDGRTGVVPESPGNSNTGVIFRGGKDKTPEQFRESLLGADRLVGEHGKPLVIDCSHNNGSAHSDGVKSAEGHLACNNHVADLLASGELTNVRGVMMESFIHAGRDEELPGFSNTDPCISIEDTASSIQRLIEVK